MVWFAATGASINTTQMKYPKLIATTLLASVFVLSPTVSAEEAKKDKKKPTASKKVKKERPLPGALGRLEMSADQKKAVTALVKETFAKREEAGKDRDKQKEIQKAHQAELSEILGEEKMAELRKLNSEMARNRKKGGSKKGNQPVKKKKKSDA